jgi:hypothetical protein
MAQPSLSIGEFARCICVANHPMFASTGNHVPCGTHMADAQRYWALLTDQGTQALNVILDVRTSEVTSLGDGQPEVARLRTIVGRMHENADADFMALPPSVRDYWHEWLDAVEAAVGGLPAREEEEVAPA